MASQSYVMMSVYVSLIQQISVHDDLYDRRIQSVVATIQTMKLVQNAHSPIISVETLSYDQRSVVRDD